MLSRCLTVTVLVLTGLMSGSWAGQCSFEDVAVGPDGYWNGSSGSGQFNSGGGVFVNNYNSLFGSWDGFAVSRTTDTTTPGYGNQYSAITGGGASGSSAYGVGYISAWAAQGPTIRTGDGLEHNFTGSYFTNTTYAYMTMCDGDSDFGVEAFDANDWLKLTITGYNSTGVSTGAVDLMLAEGTDLVDTWTWVNLTSLGAARELRFTMASSDVGTYGINTPTYFAMDNLTSPEAIPEPGTLIFLVTGLAGVVRLRRRR